jgi:hypothetical protein
VNSTLPQVLEMNHKDGAVPPFFYSHSHFAQNLPNQPLLCKPVIHVSTM